MSSTDGLTACCSVLVPSLFPFFFLSSFIVYSDCLSVVTRKMKFIEKVTGIPGEGIISILLSVIGGFPVGGKTVSALYSEEKISAGQAEYLSYICVGAGPGFLVTFVGEGIYHNKPVGILLLITSILSVFTIPFVLKPFYKKKLENTVSKPLLPNKQMPMGQCIVLSTESAVKSTLSMCGFVVVFVVVNNLMSLLPYYSGYIASMLEITSGMVNFGSGFSYETTAFLIGFGGICVHFQVFGIIKNIKTNKIYFVLIRAFQGVISALYIHILLYFFPVAENVFSSIEGKIKPQLSTTLWGGGALILLSIIFLLSNNKQEDNLCAE